MIFISEDFNWWTVEWYGLVEDDKLRNLFFESVRYYEDNKRELKYKLEDNKLLELQKYDRSFFGLNSPSIVFKEFNENIKKEIGDLILDSPFYLRDLLENIFPESLNTKLLKKNIHLIPKSIDDVVFEGYDKKGKSIETMAMFYVFGLLIENTPLLLFKIHGFDLTLLLEDYIDINYKIKKMLPTIAHSENELNKNNLNNDNLSFKEILSSIDFNTIPNIENTLKTLIGNEKTPILIFKALLKKINYFENWIRKDLRKIHVFDCDNTSKFNLKKFITQFNNETTNNDLNDNFESLEEQLLHETLSSTYGLELEDFNKIQFLIDNYGLKSIKGFNRKHKNHKLFFDFIYTVPWKALKGYDYKLHFIYIIYQFSLKLLKNVAIIPEFLEKDGKFLIRWVPSLFIEEVKDIFDKLVEVCPKDLVLFNWEIISPEQQIKILLSIFISDIFKMSDVRITNIPSSLYDLFFSLKVTEISKNDFYQLNNWVFDLHSFENDHIISFSVINGDKNDFYVGLELKNMFINKNISFKENIYNLDKETKFKVFYEMHILNKHFNKVYDLLNKSNQINLNNDQFSDFYLKTIPILKILNFKVDLPQNLKNMIKPRIISDVILKSNGVDREDLMNLENLVDFDWKIAIADKKISIKEFKKLLKKSSKFIEIGDKKYILNLDDVEVVSEKLDKIPKKFKNNQILQTLLISNNDDEFNIDEKILKLLDEIKNYKNVDIPDNLNGVLREYQYRGFSWLVQNTTFGFGSILADDMGLGKTLQVLTAILYFKNNNFLNDKKILVIAPTAILFNWQNEIEQFTPDLSFDIIHGANRTINPDIDVIISSYGMIRSNFDIFANINWFMIVVDEAQNIKNPSTKQSSFIKKLESNYKVALTGTPIENSLVDYWSIFDFTNKYYLEGLKNFKTNYLNPIEKDHDYSALEKFKAITSPFILRRLKTDEKIINDLPDKIVTECFTPLTEVQAALYQSTIDKTIDIIENSSGIERKGLVFKLINSLKQICNHPAHFTKSNKYGIDESGKMEMLVDILENTEENKEKIIIFTQFVQMGNIMVKLLEDKFKTNVMFYHGRLSRKKRDKIIKEFEDNPDKRILIVSLKAGGTGLNLTTANHVVHFDLWWNPAVENQATDRAFRIGQKSNVFVYRFITKGTFEENINRILATKKELAEITIDKNEKFLTEMSNDELKTLIMLK